MRTDTFIICIIFKKKKLCIRAILNYFYNTTNKDMCTFTCVNDIL